MEEIDIQELFKYFVKKVKLAIAIFVAVVAMGNGYYFFLQKPEFKSYSTIVLSSDESSKSLTQNDVNLNKNLSLSYAEVIKSRRILDDVNEKINYGYSYEELLGKISVSSIQDTGIIKITATEEDPEKAANIANTTAENFVKVIPTLYKVNNVNILDRATIATEPSNKNLVKMEAIFVALGAVVAALTIFVIFYFDRSVKTSEQVEQITGLPVVGKIRKIKSKNIDSELILKDSPKSNISEDIRTIRTNLQFILNDEKTKVMLLTSGSPKEGKSFTSANLATSFAQAGKNVVLVDSDLRLGRTHKIFNVSNKSGLSNLLATHDISNLDEYVKKSKIKNLDIITRGTVPPNPSELLNSEDVDKLIKKLRKQYDFVIFDGAPVNGLSDSLILANKVDKVFVVCSSNITNSNDLSGAVKSLKNINSNVAGVIINRVSENSKHNNYYGDYYTKTL